MMGPMAERDAAFLWETEALRTSTATTPREPGRHVAPGTGPIARPGWVTLRQASDVTGIPVATLRSWIRKKRIPSVLDETPTGTRRMVPLDRVLGRAEQLGRELGEVIDIRAGVAPTGLDEAPPQGMPAPPPGTMIVPIEAWDKMLLQLGNLHEAGQQLAEARERAARAETEAAFLRERLGELRATREDHAPAMGEPSQPASSRSEMRPSFTAYLWRSAISGLRRRD